MSAISLADRAFVPRSLTGSNAASNPVLDALAAIARYVPAEGIALYIAVAAFGAGVSNLALVGFIAALALNTLVIVLAWVAARRTLQGKARPSSLVLGVVILVALVSQTVYVGALAGNPLTSGMQNGTVIGGVAVLIVAAFLSTLGPSFLENTAWRAGPDDRKPGAGSSGVVDRNPVKLGHRCASAGLFRSFFDARV